MYKATIVFENEEGTVEGTRKVSESSPFLCRKKAKEVLKELRLAGLIVTALIIGE